MTLISLVLSARCILPRGLDGSISPPFRGALFHRRVEAVGCSAALLAIT